MSVDRLTRVNALLRREIGELLFRIMNERGFDLSAVSITRVETSSSLRQARVMVSIRDHEEERDKMLRILRHHAPEIQAAINRDLTLKYTPRLSFLLDTSIERGDRVLSLLSEIVPNAGNESGGEGDPTP
jgi:ribosome-binding factor A